MTVTGGQATLDVTRSRSRLTESVVVTARRVEEVAQDVPIPVSVTRGLGAPFSLTNDGIEPGVGLDIDGVCFARPAAAALDLLDVEQVEVLRGPQGTLFGKNTTAGDDVNDMNNLGVRGQILFAPSDRQWAAIAADLNYTPPSYNAVDRVTDIDTAMRSYPDMGGTSLNLDWKVGPGRLTSTTAWRFLLVPSANAATPGLRLNYDKKHVDFDQQVYGGLQTTSAALITLQRSVLAPQAYTANVDDTNLSGMSTVAFKVATRINTYATYATSFKSVGLNLNGVPADAQDRPVLSAATVKPEDVKHVELGIKTEPFRGVTANVAFYNTQIKDFQAQVVNAGVGVLRGYLANAEKVRVRGVEFDASASLGKRLSLYAAAAYTDGKYVSFPDAPPPLEETGGPQVKDISGSLLPGISKQAVSFGGEWVEQGRLLGRGGQVFTAFDTSYRSTFSSSASASTYLVVDGYALLNARFGFRAAEGWTLSLWSRNLLNTDYYDLL